jgi:hypothetical protein
LATKIGVVVPSGSTVHAQFMTCLVSLIQYSQHEGLECVLINPQSSLIATGRQMGVEAALARGCTHILWLDSDMVFPHDLLDGLLAEDAYIVGCTYVRRQPGGTLVHTERRGVEPFVGKGVREVESLPSGCLLVATSVYSDLRSPYYRCQYEEGREVGEDVWFCREARAVGYCIWLHADLSREVGHIGSYVYNLTGDIR